MKPILIVQNLSTDGPGYLATWLQRQGRPFDLRNAQAGDALPDDLRDHAALALLGGEMSANDPLPWLRRSEDLVRQAMRDGQPVIGHCLGGQLMARALGARVVASPAPEIGWQTIDMTDSAAARDWFGDLRQARVFQWHYESFELPPGAQLLASSVACPRQVFAIGPHLGMQFHIEVDAHKIEIWSHEDNALWKADLQRGEPAVQDGPTQRAQAASCLPAHQALADRLYARWLSAVPRG